ncbi:MAG: methyltransferase [Gammaproteobacteria bacterium]|nr:methyltransferase [Gammaproteobacteria bacterium]
MIEQTDSVQVHMAYTRCDEDSARIRVFPPNCGRQTEAPPRERHEVAVYDCRPLADQLDMDAAGFALRRSPTAFDGFFDSQTVQAEYYPEIARLLEQALGALAVFVFDHNVRSAERAKRGEHGVRLPVDGAHNDYTLSSGPRRIREILDEHDAAHLAPHRAALINVWRPLRGPVQDHPLAICDARTTQLTDFIPTRIQHFSEDDPDTPHLTGEVFSFRYNPAHRWYYAPDMQADEVLFLKCFDSATDGRARFTGHTGFANPACPEDYLPRESIEARTVVVYPELI